MEIKKTLIAVKKSKKDFKYFVKEDKDVHTEVGVIKADDINQAGFGGLVKSNLGKEFYILPSSFSDKFENIKRGAQIITPKDAGVIIAETGIGKDSIVVEAGTGSGGLSCMLANVVKEVYSYDLSPEAVELGKKNADMFGLKNVTFEVVDLKENAPKKEVDLVVLDMPESEKAIPNAFKMLKVGGYLIGYMPQITQVQQFVLSLGEDFLLEKVCETIQREWVITDRITRPEYQMLGHTAFLVIARKAKR